MLTPFRSVVDRRGRGVSVTRVSAQARTQRRAAGPRRRASPTHAMRDRAKPTHV